MTPSVNGQLDPSSAFTDPNDPNRLLQRRFQFWDSKHNKLGDGRGAYGFGWNFYMGPFQLTWSFAKQLPNTVEVVACTGVSPNITCDPTNPERIEDPFHKGRTVTQFYISRDF